MINLVLAVLLISYPFLVYLGLDRLGPSVVAIIIGLVFGLRVWLVHRARSRMGDIARPLLIIAGIAAAYGLLVPLVDDPRAVLLYPVVINVALVAVFAATLVRGRPMIERFARIQEPDLSPQGVRYTRGVTWAWCFFFARTVR